MLDCTGFHLITNNIAAIIASLFSIYGKIKKLKLYTAANGENKGDALVTYTKPETATVACNKVKIYNF